MGMSTGGNKGGVSSEINVTPLIDVLLVLLIIFLVVMPIMMKKETLDVPRKLNDNEQIADDTVTIPTIKIAADMSMSFNDGTSEKDESIQPQDMVAKLRPKLEAVRAGATKVVFVDFDEAVPWNQVVSTMDTIRSMAADENHDDVKVALKMKDETTPPAK